MNEEEIASGVLDNSWDGISSGLDTSPVDSSAEVTEPADPAPSLEPDPASSSTSEEETQSMEVISVEELLGRLSSGEEEAAAEAPAEETVEETGEETVGEGVEFAETGPTVEEVLESIQQSVEPHPLLTTDFADYTVTEGLLLLAMVGALVALCVKMLKEAFEWL